MAEEKPRVPMAHPANAITVEDLKSVQASISEEITQVRVKQLSLDDLAGLVRVLKKISDEVGGMDKLADCLDALSDLRRP